MIPELPVVPQPPERGAGEEQKPCPLLQQRFQVRDRPHTVDRVVAGVNSVLVPEEVPASCARLIRVPPGATRTAPAVE
jgi:hypothetical protein